MATDRVRAQIIVDQVAKNEGIEPTVEEVSALIVKQAREQGQSVAALEKWVSAEPSRIRYFELEVVRSKVLELLEGRATVTYTAPQKVEEVTEEVQTGDEGAEQSGTEKGE
jgi:FKBP-type peptidyl-prolyl cis-trans isomerase (trigger factor)